jgi:hypothetical protein
MLKVSNFSRLQGSAKKPRTGCLGAEQGPNPRFGLPAKEAYVQKSPTFWTHPCFATFQVGDCLAIM